MHGNAQCERCNTYNLNAFSEERICPDCQDALRNGYRLRFKSGQWFVAADDLHSTTWTTDRDAATTFPTAAAALDMAHAMMRTQGIRLYGTQA